MVTVIDTFPHILPKPVLDRFCTLASGWTKSYMDGLLANPALTPHWDLDARFRQMDEAGDYAQVPTLNMPPIEHMVQGVAGADLARLANDTLAELTVRYPDRFLGFAAALPMDDPDAAVLELDRAVSQLGALGTQIFTNANGLPLDDPRFEPLFARAAELGCLIWVHGARASTLPEFAGESESGYGMWLALGWPYEMGLFAGRLVLSGLFDRHPSLRIYLHHSGGMISTFAHRISGGGFQYGPPGHEEQARTVSALTRPPLEYFRQFYVDTSGQAPLTIELALQFFGRDRVLLGSDAPFRAPAAHLKTIQDLSLSREDREQVMGANARRVLGIS
jgi:aminocarboxymuconate-semialdehyde decarboxylase